MRNYLLNFFIQLFIVFGVNLSFAQSPQANLERADSLFSQQKFTESFEIYERLLETYQQSSPQMLLKMAFIKEGLRDYSKALYYLNLYYLQTTDKKVLKKMEELAENHNLSGYEYADWEFFMMLYRKYNASLTYMLLALALILFAVIFRQKRKYDQKPVTTGVLLTLTLGILFYHVNFSDNYNRGIIVQTDAYIMDAPSSGADLVRIIDKGHRVKVIDKKDVWVEIEWEGNIAYIRENNIATLH